MDIKEKLKYLLMLTAGPRQTGRTTVLKEAADKIDGTFITETVAHAKEIGGEAFSPMNLLGRHKPLILDHYFQTHVFRQSLAKIEELENKLNTIKEIVCD